jgi:Leucine-rich repeat (LRR) protein
MLENLVELDLSHQKHGLTGRIPDEISKMSRLSFLSLAGNKLDQSIPSTIGNLPYIKVLNLSLNTFSQSIPPELGRLKGKH